VLTLLNLYEENSMNIRFRLALSVLCVTFLGLLVPSALRADNLVSNGNFASGGIDWTFTPAASGSDFFYETFPGDTYAAFGGLSTGYYDTIAQTLSTQSGQSYTLSFLIANDYGTQDADFQTLWDGVEVGDVSGINWFGYTEYTFDVTGTGGDTLSFEGYQVPSWYNLTDVSVSTTATPEPSSLYLLGTGLVALGGLVRRKLRA
jgi:hypothetical protein